MCRNIKTLANFAPPATEEEIRASALQFVRKLSGSTRPSRANEAVFNRAVEDVCRRHVQNRRRCAGSVLEREAHAQRERRHAHREGDGQRLSVRAGCATAR